MRSLFPDHVVDKVGEVKQMVQGRLEESGILFQLKPLLVQQCQIVDLHSVKRTEICAWIPYKVTKKRPKKYAAAPAVRIISEGGS